MVTQGKTTWTQFLSRGTSAQQAELLSSTQALHCGEDKSITIHTDSRYAFSMAHVRGSLQGIGIANFCSKRNKKKKERNLNPLEAIWLGLGGGHCPLQRAPGR